MKTILVAVGCLFLAAASYAAQPNSIGNVKVKKIGIDVYTLAQINALQPDTTNQFVGCSDCTQTALCVSSGSILATHKGAFVVPISTAAFPAYTTIHCR